MTLTEAEKRIEALETEAADLDTRLKAAEGKIAGYDSALAGLTNAITAAGYAAHITVPEAPAADETT